MSWGYIPKKLKRQRRQRLLRKKYKNFSCDTCRFAEVCLKGLCSRTSGKGRVEFCFGWKKANKANDATTCSEKKEKTSFFKKFFK